MENIYEHEVKVVPESEAENRLIELLLPALNELGEIYQLNVGSLGGKLYHKYCFSKKVYQTIQEHLSTEEAH